MENREMPLEELERRYNALKRRNTTRRASLKKLNRAIVVKGAMIGG